MKCDLIIQFNLLWHRYESPSVFIKDISLKSFLKVNPETICRHQFQFARANGHNQYNRLWSQVWRPNIESFNSLALPLKGRLNLNNTITSDIFLGTCLEYLSRVVSFVSIHTPY